MLSALPRITAKVGLKAFDAGEEISVGGLVHWVVRLSVL